VLTLRLRRWGAAGHGRSAAGRAQNPYGD
jgi:hypothetical protein